MPSLFGGALLALLLSATLVAAGPQPDPQPLCPQALWPDLAPGETSRDTGEWLPARPGEDPPVTRLKGVALPTFTLHRPPHPNGTAVVILPGGGFGRVVTNKEGTEAAEWLNRLGVTALVLRYRTSDTAPTGDSAPPPWRRPLQDAQRLLKLTRARATEWQLDPRRVGLLGFSAGGQVAARLLCDGDEAAYPPADDIDRQPHRPDFALLLYPWNLTAEGGSALLDGLTPPAGAPSCFLVHTDDDRSSALGSALFYVALKSRGVASELHVYGHGGHGYGLRPVAGSDVGDWPSHATTWLRAGGWTPPTAN